MSGANKIIGPGGDAGDEFVEVRENSNPEDDLIDSLERRIELLNKLNEDHRRKLDELYRRLTSANETLEAQQKKVNDSFVSKLRASIIFLLGLIMSFVAANIGSPEFLELLTRDTFSKIGLALSLVLVIVFILLPKQRTSVDDTFLDIDRSFGQRADKSESTVSNKGAAVNLTVNTSSGQINSGDDDADQEKLEVFPRQVLGAGSDFEFCISEIVEYLGDHIKLSDTKASKLLDKGTTYLRRGLYFYIGSIIAWQIWGHFVSFDGLVIAGMISTSIAFIIIEFLAAWFLKQYRSFVDSSMAYMRVQSFFNRYLLLYFAALEFGDDEEGSKMAKNELLKVIALEIKWPDLKDVNANDFNYMIEAMGSMHTSFEKLKGVFQNKSGKRK